MQGISGKAANFGIPQNKRKFNDGTELNVDLDINFYETDFRSYDPQIGRFGQIDPVEGISLSFSLYSFSSNNPIRYNDPLGLWTDSIKTKDGSYAYSNNPNLAPVTVKPPRKSKPFGGFHFPKTQKDQSKWNDEMYARHRDGKALHQPGDPEWLADQSSFHKRNFQAGQDHRRMSIGAVLCIASPILVTSLSGTSFASASLNFSSTIVKKYGASFLFNTGLQFGINGRDADLFDAAISTLNPAAGVIGGAVFDIRPFSEGRNFTSVFSGSKSVPASALDFFTGLIFMGLGQGLNYNLGGSPKLDVGENMVAPIEMILNNSVNERIKK